MTASLTALPAFGLLASCGGSKKLRLALNWKPDPQFGGFYAAPFKERKLDVEILPGGAGTPTVQMIGAGSAEFGVVSADELVVARSRGNDVVALFAVFQDTPQGLMVHAERKLAAIEEIFEEGTVALQRGLPYARLLEKQFGFDHVKIVPSPGGDITAFLNDPLFAQQCFIMSEPLQAKKAGANVTVFPVADVGYNPYTTVVATNGKYLKENAGVVEQFVSAVRAGWKTYVENPKPTNGRMHDLNPSMDPSTFSEVAEAQVPFIKNDDTEAAGLGSMKRERWEKLIGQLHGLGDIPEAISPDDCFRVV
ncbi:MAG: ABC transporter substrate-binding protein [Acidobacteriota bacterium]